MNSRTIFRILNKKKDQIKMKKKVLKVINVINNHKKIKTSNLYVFIKWDVKEKIKRINKV